MNYVEALTEYDLALPAVFLAGGITNCPDWQSEAASRLASDRWAVLNPRRADFPINDPNAATAQVDWEFRHLERAHVVLFWFSSGPSVQPIALYELGRHVALDVPIAVGADPDYLRRVDVVLQLGHARPDSIVYDSLADTCAKARRLLHQIKGGPW